VGLVRDLLVFLLPLLAALIVFSGLAVPVSARQLRLLSALAALLVVVALVLWLVAVTA